MAKLTDDEKNELWGTLEQAFKEEKVDESKYSLLKEGPTYMDVTNPYEGLRTYFSCAYGKYSLHLTCSYKDPNDETGKKNVENLKKLSKEGKMKDVALYAKGRSDKNCFHIVIPAKLDEDFAIELGNDIASLLNIHGDEDFETEHNRKVFEPEEWAWVLFDLFDTYIIKNAGIIRKYFKEIN